MIFNAWDAVKVCSDCLRQLPLGARVPHAVGQLLRPLLHFRVFKHALGQGGVLQPARPVLAAGLLEAVLDPLFESLVSHQLPQRRHLRRLRFHFFLFQPPPLLQQQHLLRVVAIFLRLNQLPFGLRDFFLNLRRMLLRVPSCPQQFTDAFIGVGRDASLPALGAARSRSSRRRPADAIC